MNGGMAMTEVVRHIIAWLIRAARTRTWGELRVVVQNGEITGVHEQRSYRGRLPAHSEEQARVRQSVEQLLTD